MNNLSEEEFRNSMKKGAFYFSYEPNGSKSVDPSYGIAMTPKLKDLIIDGNSIQIIVDDVNSIEWYDENSQIVGEDSILDISIIDSNFIRAVLINEYGRTYTQPFGIEKT